MTPPIHAVCAADAAVTLVLGAQPLRLFQWGEIPERPAYPYAVWQVIGGTPESYLAGRPDVDAFTIQVDVYGKTGSSTTTAATVIRDAIELHANITRWGGQQTDPVTKNKRISFDIDWLVPR
ncbi:MAG TPA: DUF3168 domain-containing protein [Pseudomonas xinjiangensis]|uniref:DUF3168 domain-containing protein n=2 Tax=root TaxID=1 RepID=A0A7V1BLN9_9GAMM|nr:DUF3168 domain-containing protein [Halopseudomonas xinjiangensis]HEC47154.1 DUF3168 domain-containing protein [Halopseudomonas xinjiangensis]